MSDQPRVFVTRELPPEALERLEAASLALDLWPDPEPPPAAALADHEADDGAMVMKWQLPGGTSLDRKGPRYNQLLDNYLVNQPIDFPFGADAITNPQETLTVEPAPGG